MKSTFAAAALPFAHTAKNALEKLTATADCGFSALPRAVAREKMRALVAGARLVRGQRSAAQG